jgi:hypothetical protein
MSVIFQILMTVLGWIYVFRFDPTVGEMVTFLLFGVTGLLSGVFAEREESE